MRTYGTSLNDYGRSLIINYNASGQPEYTISGYFYNGGQYDGLMIKTNSARVTIWSRKYGLGGHDYAYDLTENAINGGTFSGYTYSIGTGTADLYLVETDLDGATKTKCDDKFEFLAQNASPCKTSSAQQVFVDSEKEIRLDVKRMEIIEDECSIIYLKEENESEIAKSNGKEKINIFSDQYILKFIHESDYLNGIIEIFDLTGKRIVYEKILDEASTEINTSEMTKGIYVIKMHSDNVKLFTTKYFVK